jgi:hypothetical protein
VRRPTVIPNRLFEECLGCGYISCPTEPGVDSLPSLIYCPIQIGPLSAYLEIGFIDSPRAASAAAKAIPPLDELWRIPSNPAQNRRMGKLESSFDHHLHQITEAELVHKYQRTHRRITSRSSAVLQTTLRCFSACPLSVLDHKDHSIRRHLAICTRANHPSPYALLDNLEAF